MMFLVRSAFWLSIVYAHMPFDSDEALRAVEQTRSVAMASAAHAAKDKCAQDAVSCRAILSAAAGLILAPDAEASKGPAPAAQRADARGKALRPSANSLSANDLAAPWRGRPVKSGA
jgi:hypothetical protein